MTQVAAPYDVVYCECDAPNLPSSTVCGECGEKLKPPAPPVASSVSVSGAHDLDCPCVRCTIARYDAGVAL